MKYVEVTEFDPGPASEYLAAAYPSSGLYWVPRMGQYRLIANGVVTCIIGMHSPKELVKESPTPAAPPAPSISEDFVLRALAICQQPTLATSLLPVKAA